MATNISLLSIVVATSLACRDKPRDCVELKQAGFTSTGEYIIIPDKQSGGLRVRCEMTTAEVGWTVIQRRISNTSFHHDWNIYERGFGNPGDSYWLGNLPISKFTEQDGYQLRVDMRHSNGSHAFSLYNFFKMYDVRSNYQGPVSLSFVNKNFSCLTLAGGCQVPTIYPQRNAVPSSDACMGLHSLCVHNAWCSRIRNRKGPLIEEMTMSQSLKTCVNKMLKNS